MMRVPAHDLGRVGAAGNAAPVPEIGPQAHGFGPGRVGEVEDVRDDVRRAGPPGGARRNEAVRHEGDHNDAAGRGDGPDGSVGQVPRDVAEGLGRRTRAQDGSPARGQDIRDRPGRAAADVDDHPETVALGHDVPAEGAQAEVCSLRPVERRGADRVVGLAAELEEPDPPGVKGREKGDVGPEGVAVGETEIHRAPAELFELVRVGGGEADTGAFWALFDRVDDGRDLLKSGVQRRLGSLGGRKGRGDRDEDDGGVETALFHGLEVERRRAGGSAPRAGGFDMGVQGQHPEMDLPDQVPGGGGDAVRTAGNGR
jgi:hypothetical protein